MASQEREISNIELGKRLIRETLPPRWKLYVLSLVLMVGVAGFTAALAYSTKLIINEVFVADDFSSAWKVAALVVGVSAGASLSEYGNAVIGAVFQRSISSYYQRRIFNASLEKDVSYFSGKHPAKMMNRAMIYGKSAASVVVKLSNKMLTDGLTLIFLIGVMVAQDPLMSLTAAVLFPIVFLLVTQLSKRIKAIVEAETELSGALHAVGTETFEGIKTVKSYHLEERSRQRFSDAVQKLENRILSIARVTAATVPSMQLLGGLVLGLYVIYASWQTLSNGKTPGEFTAFISAFLLAYQPAERLSKVFVDLQKDIFRSKQMCELIDEPPELKPVGNETLEGREATLTFEGVSFRYLRSVPALRNVSFGLNAGEKIAIVGRSGAGKTTLIDLVQRFYDPTKGRILIGGVDIRELSEEALREGVALISQDVFLFEGTIRANIADGRRGASDEEILAAARMAELGELIDTLPDGLDSEVGANGRALSGGQKQRVGIARAILKDSKIFIFDEATSALDGENERAILSSVIRSNPEKTMIFVTHRPATLQWVDRVLLLESGRVLALDSHEVLMAEYPIYRSLFNLPTHGDPDADDRSEEILSEEAADETEAEEI